MHWLVIEQTASFRDISVRMGNITASKVAIKRFEFPKMRELRQQTLPKHLEKLVQSGAFTNCHVKTLIDRSRVLRGCSKQVGLNDVRDVTEVPASLAISVDMHWFILDHCCDPFWNDRCIRSVRILSRTKYVEVA